jgi:hypothetical protein
LKLIHKLEGKAEVTAIAYERVATNVEIQPTIGDTSKPAEFVAVVVALLCPEAP